MLSRLDHGSSRLTDEFFSPCQQLVMQRDLDGADVGTRTAQTARVRQALVARVSRVGKSTEPIGPGTVA